MKQVTQLVLVVAFAVCTLSGQELPFGVAGQQGLELRALSHHVAPTYIPVTWSACGTARVDGILSPGEWSGAATHVITVNTAAGAVPATLYVMNDNLTLHVAIKFPEPSPNYGSLAIEFDNDNDGVPLEAGDDVIVYNNQLGFADDFRQPCSLGMCAPEDTTAPPGSTEGRGAYVNDGTNSVYELSHSFKTFDFGHDLVSCIPGFGLCATTTVGFFIMLRQIESNGAIHDTYYPDFAVYDQIAYQDCRVPILSGCGTADVDGKIGSVEWSSAGKYRLSVQVTPRGDTAPGTFYLMNDSFNVYAGLAFDEPASLVFNEVVIRFDNNPSTWIGDDRLFFVPGAGFFDDVGVPCPPPPLGAPPCWAGDTGVGGTNDGAGALANNGAQTAIEISHPLNSGDSNDFALSFGNTVPYRFSYISAATPPPTVASVTDVPDFSQGQAFGLWKICGPGPAQSVRDLSQRIDALDQSGALSPKNADTLTKDLIKADGNIKSGKLKQAANDLNNFVNDVTKMMRKGELPDRLGQPLIGAANSAISQL